jgi:putative flippase GtrA
MKRLLRFGRYGALGIVNTVLGYVMFISLALVFNQLIASFITEISMQLFKYYGLGRFVFIGENSRRPTLIVYVLSIMPGSLVIFASVAIVSHFTAAPITGLISLLVSVIYYKIFKYLYRVH